LRLVVARKKSGQSSLDGPLSDSPAFSRRIPRAWVFLRTPQPAMQARSSPQPRSLAGNRAYCALLSRAKKAGCPRWTARWLIRPPSLAAFRAPGFSCERRNLQCRRSLLRSPDLSREIALLEPCCCAKKAGSPRWTARCLIRPPSLAAFRAAGFSCERRNPQCRRGLLRSPDLSREIELIAPCCRAKKAGSPRWAARCLIRPPSLAAFRARGFSCERRNLQCRRGLLRSPDLSREIALLAPCCRAPKKRAVLAGRPAV